MTKEEIINKAQYIQFAFTDNIYADYYDVPDGKYIYKVPVVDYPCFYTQSLDDQHHFITKYHREVVLPFLESILRFGYNDRDFFVKPYFLKDEIRDMDLSYQVPIIDKTFDIENIADNYIYKNMRFDGGLVMNSSLRPISSYRDLIILPHHSLIIKNNGKNNDRTLLLNGDSQSIYSVPILSYYYKEVWFLDNRSGMKDDGIVYWDDTPTVSDRLTNQYFDDVLFQFYSNYKEWYIDWNMK